MTDFDSGEKAAPWRDQRDKIKVVEMENGVTSIGSFAFYELIVMTDVIIPNTVETICTRLSVLVIIC